MENNMLYWDKMRTVPKSALKQIQAGRLKGMSDISPAWRLEIMTSVFGPCGIGWKYEVTKLSLEPAAQEQVVAFAEINLYVKDGEKWSSPIPGTGGSMFIVKEKMGLHVSDECFKMATTDALSVAMKALGVGADVYMGKWDGSKYKTEPLPDPPKDNKTPSNFNDTDERGASSAWILIADKNSQSVAALGEWYKGIINAAKRAMTPDQLVKFNLYVTQLKKTLAEKTVTCPETDATVKCEECQGKPCKNGCPAYDK